MSQYTPVANFTNKDSLITGNPLKAVKGTELGTEFAAVQTAVNSKFDGAVQFAPDGAVGQPSFGFTNNAGTGMYNVAGVLNFATNSIQRFSVALGGAVAVSAPTSGTAFSSTALAGQYAARFVGASSGVTNGVQIQAGAVATDIAFEVENQGGTLNSFIVFGDTGVAVGNLGTSPGAGILNALNGLQINSSPVYAGIPQTSVSGNYTLVITDANKHIRQGTGGSTVTIPANASVPFPIGTAVTFCNRTAGTMTIAITTDTLQFSANNTFGSRTLASNGMATAIKTDATVWLISGSAIT